MSPGPGYVAALAVEGHDLRIKCWQWPVPRGVALFNSLFVFQNFPDGPIPAQGGSFEIYLDHSFQRTNLPLAMMVVPSAELSLTIVFDPARFDSVTIRRMLGDFQALVRDINADPEQRVLGLPLFTEVEARSSCLGRKNCPDRR